MKTNKNYHLIKELSSRAKRSNLTIHTSEIASLEDSFAMKIGLFISLLILILSVSSLAQNSQVKWSSFSSGFGKLNNAGTTCISSVGESFIRKSSNGTSIIISGFLAYQSGDFISGTIVPNLPIPLATGGAEVWGDSIYYFGGTNNFGGQNLYQSIYKFNGNSWSYYDSIPDNNLYGIETVIAGNDVYLLGGWPDGASLNRRYNFVSKEWDYLTGSPNSGIAYGLTAEYFQNKIYLFDRAGEVFAYDIVGNNWEIKSQNTVSANFPGQRSVIYNNEIYVIGWDNSGFYKYSPSGDQWTELAQSPFQVYACAMEVINDNIYCVGGNSSFKNVIVYNIAGNEWNVDSVEISSRRDWMADAVYNGSFYVFGGLDVTLNAVDIVEKVVPGGIVSVDGEKEIIPTDYKLNQNFPNPFNPSTVISWQLPVRSHISLKVYDILGSEVVTLVDENREAGYYETRFDGSALASGMYIYRLTARDYVSTKKMLMIK